MSALLSIVRLLAMVIWVGGLCFFAFVLAPVAFHVLPSTHEAGLVVGGTLNVLHPIGLCCGIVFLIATALSWVALRQRSNGSGRLLLVGQLWLAVGMMLATAFVQRTLIPTMERDRVIAGGNIDAAPPDNAARLDFEHLHAKSEKVEGTVLLLGLGVVVLMGMESGRSSASSL